MKTNLIYGPNPAPTAYLTKGKQRVKQYGNIVYLKNGEEFEIELFNPTTNKVLAEIELNGKSLGDGIILRPGERVFLERYLDEARKFLFETYVVNGKSEEVKKAIENNGDVHVRFYNERYDSHNFTSWSSTTSNFPMFNLDKDFYIPCSNTTTSRYINYSSTFTSGENVLFSGTITTNSMPSTESFDTNSKKKSLSKEIETGRVEKGSHSNQSFEYDTTKFNLYSTWESIWKILPVSQKAITKEDLSIYCTQCGARRKKTSHVFCPICGNKF